MVSHHTDIAKTAPITVIGIGEDGYDGLSPVARAALARASVIFGGKRHLALLPGDIGGDKRAWISPFEDNLALIAAMRDRGPVVLASGDPMFFGVGNTLIDHFGSGSISVIPHPSSISLLCARLGRALADCDVITLHGRPLAGLAARLRPRGQIIALSQDGETVRHVAALLKDRGYGDSPITVCERLGGAAEKITSHTATQWGGDKSAIDPLNILMIDLVAGPKAQIWGQTGGLPDDAFIHDGMITKSHVRAISLASLSPWKGAVLWDLGAGCGSVAIEWMRAGGDAFAIERDASRCAMMRQNADHLGVPGLHILQGDIADKLPDLPTPDAIFVGGGITTPDLMRACWDRLPPHGRLVANAVTLQGDRELLSFQNEFGGTLSRLQVSHIVPRGGFDGWHSLAPVTHYLGLKS